MLFDLDLIERVYKKMQSELKLARSVVNRPLTLTEKILYTHLAHMPTGSCGHAGCNGADGAFAIHAGK